MNNKDVTEHLQIFVNDLPRGQYNLTQLNVAFMRYLRKIDIKLESDYVIYYRKPQNRGLGLIRDLSTTTLVKIPCGCSTASQKFKKVV